MRDSRLVQTAVIGDEHSDVPVVLPPEAIELDVFRHAHEGDTFWCGVLLGGCGAQLATKLYVDRQCHFQHFPQPNGMPNPCRRPAVGESSADHLYVKSALSRSLLDHGRAARFAFPPPIGSVVDVDLEDGTSLRIHMDGSVRPDWDVAERTVVLGPGVVPEPGTLAGCPYVYRVRCDSDGATRRVWIGTQSLAHPTDWIPLGECTWGDEGLLTPTAARLLRTRATDPSRTATESPSVQSTALPENVVTFVRGLEAAQRTGTVEHVRRLCAGGDSLLPSLTPPVRTEVEKALAEARAWLATHEEYQHRLFAELETAVRERRAWDVRSRLQQAAALTRRGASVSEQRVLAAARSYLRGQDRVEEPRATPALRREASYRPTPPAPKKPKKEPRPAARKARSQRRQEAAADARKLLKYLRREERSLPAAELKRLVGNLVRAARTAGDELEPKDRLTVVSWEQKSERRQRAASRRDSSRTESERPARNRERPEHTQLDPLAHAVRAVLQKAASSGTTLTWAQIRQQLPPELPALERSEQTPLLIRIDRSRDSSAPLLSALVTGADHDMHPAYPRIAAALGRPATNGDLAALAQWAVEVSRFRRRPAK